MVVIVSTVVIPMKQKHILAEHICYVALFKIERTGAILLLIPQNDGSSVINCWAEKADVLKDKSADSLHSS